VQQRGKTEYSAECPRCGGIPHNPHDWPDRFRLFADEHPRVWCRRCGYFAWVDELGANAVPPSHEDLERFRREQIAREEARKRSAERALEHLRNEAEWRRFHDQMDDAARAYWRTRGIPDDWQDYWSLGFRHDLRIRLANGEWAETPAATIPLPDPSGRMLNIKMRLVDPPAGVGRYRYQLPGQPEPLFIANQNEPIQGHVIAVEGEIKSMVLMIYLGDLKAVIVGMPGTNPSQSALDQLGAAERITLVMDPDSREAAHKLAERLGKQRCRLLVASAKIDDAIIAIQPSSYSVRQWLAQARSAA